MIKFTTVKFEDELKQILELQHENLFANVSEEEQKSQGFVTVEHDPVLLAEMNKKHPHIIAKFEEKVVGYALVELIEFGYRIPELIEMTENTNRQSYKGVPLTDYNYFFMGQVCIDKEFRGQKIFYGLYDKMVSEMKEDFDLIVTEVDGRNTRSMRAHKNAGWELLLNYENAQGLEWNMIVLDLRKAK